MLGICIVASALRRSAQTRLSGGRFEIESPTPTQETEGLRRGPTHTCGRVGVGRRSAGALRARGACVGGGGAWRGGLACLQRLVGSQCVGPAPGGARGHQDPAMHVAVGETAHVTGVMGQGRRASGPCVC